MCFTFKCKQISKAQKTSEGSLQPEKDRPKKKKNKHTLLRETKETEGVQEIEGTLKSNQNK